MSQTEIATVWPAPDEPREAAAGRAARAAPAISAACGSATAGLNTGSMIGDALVREIHLEPVDAVIETYAHTRNLTESMV